MVPTYHYLLYICTERRCTLGFMPRDNGPRFVQRAITIGVLYCVCDVFDSEGWDA